MSPLTEALDRILNWWQQHGYEVASYLLPGLTYDEIEEVVKDLPVRLPEEFYELYQWRNGCGGNESWYLPLQQAVTNYLRHLGCYDSYRNGHYWFPIFSYIKTGEEGYLVIGLDKQNCSVIFMSNKDNGITQKYESLTSMMLTFAECRENGVGERDERGYQIWRKYNISIVEKALTELQNNLSLQSLSEISVDLMMFKDSRAVEPLIQVLEIPLSLADPYESVGIQKLAAQILGELDDSRAIEPLIRALQNPHRWIRQQAVSSLGHLRDERAVEPLIKALGDSEKDVSSKAAVSLAYLKAVDQLIQALKHNDGYVRMLAVRSLGDIKDPKALEPLSQLTEDSDPNVRKTAIIALKKIRQKY